MIRLRIDNTEVEVPQGSTILDAARKLGLDIPTLCFLDGLKPATSCMICLVKVKKQNRLVPSCATPVEDGMEVESETDEVHAIRRTGLELLLSDHVGDCTAPCQNTCPTHMDIPLMLRQVGAGELHEAIATIKKDIALPAVLGRVCPDLCEHGCRRGDVDSPAAICQVKRHVADVDLASPAPYLPPCKPSSGKSVAIVGAGPTGLSAAFHLLQCGHACTLFDDRDEPGGMLRSNFDEGQLPRNVLDAEIAVIRKLGAQLRMGVRVGRDASLAELRQDFDAVLIAIGSLVARDGPDPIYSLGLQTARDRVVVDSKTHETSLPGVFAAGDAVQPTKLAVRSVAQGKEAAICVDQYLSGATVTGPPKEFNSRTGRLSREEIVPLTLGVSDADRVTPAGGSSAGLTDVEARSESQRCLHCECSHHIGCKLRKYATLYGASATCFGRDRRVFERQLQHAEIIYEPGKCIVCGLCIRIATEAKEPLGLTFIGRGFDVRMGVPFDRSIAAGLTLVAGRCADACPTGALSRRMSHLHDGAASNS